MIMRQIITTEMSANENQTVIGCITHADIDIMFKQLLYVHQMKS